VRPRARPRRAPQTGLPDDVVLAIVVAVVAEHGSFDLDACIVRLAAERARRCTVLVFPTALQLARECCPTGAA
jgi:hypothetical protein